MAAPKRSRPARKSQEKVTDPRRKNPFEAGVQMSRQHKKNPRLRGG